MIATHPAGPPGRARGLRGPDEPVYDLLAVSQLLSTPSHQQPFPQAFFFPAPPSPPLSASRQKAWIWVQSQFCPPHFFPIHVEFCLGMGHQFMTRNMGNAGGIGPKISGNLGHNSPPRHHHLSTIINIQNWGISWVLICISTH